MGKKQLKHRGKLAAAGLYGTGALLLYIFTLQAPGPLAPPVAAPQAGQPEGQTGQVVADDEKPASPPYRHIAGPGGSLSKPQPNGFLAELGPATDGSSKKPRRPAERYVTIDNKLYPLRTYKPLLVPNDPSASQWWVSNAKLDQTWDIPPGSHQTLLAVIDTGFGLKHEEFADRWYINPGESGAAASEQPSARNCADRGLTLDASCNLIDDDSDGTVDNEIGAVTYQNPSRLNCSDQAKPLAKDCNRVDDDGNGYVDDVTGWDFANNDNAPQAGELNPAGSGTTHGTRVAGIAAATGNNGKGLAGVDWQTKILPIQALDDDSYGDTRGVGRAIYYAAARGADVISLSLGSELPDEYVREAIRAATAAGSVVVAASGNDGCDCIAYPANYPEVVAVGALHTDSQPASFSSYGSGLDILAPGTQMTTANWTSSNPTSAYSSGVNGTSFAAPLVSGLLTRILSLRPNATPLQLIAALTENTNRLTLAAGTAHSSQLGYGTADGFKATSRMTTARTAVQSYGLSPASLGNRLSPAQPAEVAGNYIVQLCEPGALGTTPLYELTKSGSQFFSISPTEVWLAGRAGYQSQFFARICLQQPHDRPDTIRNIQLYKEFRHPSPER